jgi:hypothetical protein
MAITTGAMYFSFHEETLRRGTEVVSYDIVGKGVHSLLLIFQRNVE